LRAKQPYIQNPFCRIRRRAGRSFVLLRRFLASLNDAFLGLV
jgi:hypothetical protein